MLSLQRMWNWYGKCTGGRNDNLVFTFEGWGTSLKFYGTGLFSWSGSNFGGYTHFYNNPVLLSIFMGCKMRCFYFHPRHLKFVQKPPHTKGGFIL